TRKVDDGGGRRQGGLPGGEELGDLKDGREYARRAPRGVLPDGGARAWLAGVGPGVSVVTITVSLQPIAPRPGVRRVVIRWNTIPAQSGRGPFTLTQSPQRHQMACLTRTIAFPSRGDPQASRHRTRTHSSTTSAS